MLENDIRKTCNKFADKLGIAFRERITRSIKEDFDKALEERPKELLTTILEDVHLRLILPLEMSLEIGNYFIEIYDIKEFILALSEKDHLYYSERRKEIEHFVNIFYRIIGELGLLEQFKRPKERWWK